MEEERNLELEQRYRFLYADASADVILSKRLEEHFLKISTVIDECNEHIDKLKTLENDSFTTSFRAFTYEFYRLKDKIVIAIGDKKI